MSYSVGIILTLTLFTGAESQFLMDNRTGQVRYCDQENGCPPGYNCMYDRVNGASKMCFRATELSAPRQGSCPYVAASESVQLLQTNPHDCRADQDCPAGTKCCYAGNFCFRCVPPVRESRDTRPQIILLDEGLRSSTSDGTSTTMKASIVLIRSRGKNVLFDTGVISQKVTIIQQLHQKAGLQLSDIDFVITSHGHLDHVGNNELFPDTPINFGVYTITGSRFATNSLKSGEPFNVLDDPNLQLLTTPGHTLEDTTLLVHNVPTYGTVAVSGDLFVKEDDESEWQASSQNPDLQLENRRKVICLADYILPGHGAMFPVTLAMKQKAGECQGAQVK